MPDIRGTDLGVQVRKTPELSGHRARAAHINSTAAASPGAGCAGLRRISRETRSRPRAAGLCASLCPGTSGNSGDGQSAGLVTQAALAVRHPRPVFAKTGAIGRRQRGEPAGRAAFPRTAWMHGRRGQRWSGKRRHLVPGLVRSHPDGRADARDGRSHGHARGSPPGQHRPARRSSRSPRAR